jgi:peptidoglycan hydrolase-like amidase
VSRFSGIALGLVLCLSAPVAAMAPRPAGVRARVQAAAAAWRNADVSACAGILEPLAANNPLAAREWAAFLFLQERYGDLEAFFGSTPSAVPKDDEARLWLARAQLDQSHFDAALSTLRSLSQSARPLPLALAAEAAAGRAPAWPGAWPPALSATSGTRWEASTALAAAEQAEAAGALAEAEDLYKRAEKADPSFSLVHARLAKLYGVQGRFKDQRIRLERALRVDPDHKGLRADLNRLLRRHPGLKRGMEKEAHLAVERFLARRNPGVAPLPRVQGEPLVRVGLLDQAPRFRLKLGGAYWVEGQGRTLPANSAWEARLGAKGGWELRPLSPSTESPLSFSQILRLQPLDDGSTFGLYDVDHGAGYFWAEKEDRYYRGVAELRPQKARGLTLVNELGMEAYLVSVVPSEAPSYWPSAALEAQAMAARTDAWRSLGRFNSKGYDLCPTVACAVYSGVGVEQARSTRAVTATAGLVLESPNGRLHPTFYMHHSGGYTQEPWEAWTGGFGKPGKGSSGMAVPDAPPGAQVRQLFPVTPASLLHYLDDLDGDVDVWARESSSFRWTLRFSADEADQWVQRRHKVTPLIAVLPLERSVGGYVSQALFDGEMGASVGGSDHLRSALKGMKSNLFYAELRQDGAGNLKALLLHGGGWGHGVGMAQAGAKAQAEAGRNAAQILHAYFPQARLKRRYPGP